MAIKWVVLMAVVVALLMVMLMTAADEAARSSCVSASRRLLLLCPQARPPPSLPISPVSYFFPAPPLSLSFRAVGQSVSISASSGPTHRISVSDGQGRESAVGDRRSHVGHGIRRSRHPDGTGRGGGHLSHILSSSDPSPRKLPPPRETQARTAPMISSISCACGWGSDIQPARGSKPTLRLRIGVGRRTMRRAKGVGAEVGRGGPRTREEG
eukprot:5498934-Pyramimonas_sp.AAC.4